jgi:hypothetical protein
MDKTHLRCINLDRRPDRWRLFGHGLKSTTLKTLPLKRFGAVDGRRLAEEIDGRDLRNEKIIGLLRDESYAAGVLGCLLSHYLLWREIASDDEIGHDDAVIVFEDDARFCLYDYDDVLSEIHGVPKTEWVIMYLGGRWWPSFVPNDDPGCFRHLSGHVFRRRIDKSRIGRSVSVDRCTTAYATHKRGALLMAEATEQYLAMRPFHAIDYILVDVFSESGSLDYFPHVVYSPLSHDASDAQEPLRISTRVHDENAADGPAAPAGGTTVSSS